MQFLSSFIFLFTLYVSFMFTAFVIGRQNFVERTNKFEKQSPSQLDYESENPSHLHVPERSSKTSCTIDSSAHPSTTFDDFDFVPIDPIVEWNMRRFLHYDSRGRTCTRLLFDWWVYFWRQTLFSRLWEFESYNYAFNTFGSTLKMRSSELSSGRCIILLLLFNTWYLDLWIFIMKFTLNWLKISWCIEWQIFFHRHRHLFKNNFVTVTLARLWWPRFCHCYALHFCKWKC